MNNTVLKEFLICVKNNDSLEIVRTNLIDAGFKSKVMKVTNGRERYIIQISSKGLDQTDEKSNLMKLINDFKAQYLIIWHGERAIERSF
jgi:hypothetical protein